MSRALRMIREEVGSALVETALSLSLLLMTILGVFYCSWALYAYEFVSYAAQQGARYAIVRGSYWTSACSPATAPACNATSANVVSYVQSLATAGISTNNLVVTPSWSGLTLKGATCSIANGPGCMVKVQVTYNFSFSLPLIPVSAMTFRSTSQQVIQD